MIRASALMVGLTMMFVVGGNANAGHGQAVVVEDAGGVSGVTLTALGEADCVIAQSPPFPTWWQGTEDFAATADGPVTDTIAYVAEGDGDHTAADYESATWTAMRPMRGATRGGAMVVPTATPASMTMGP